MDTFALGLILADRIERDGRLAEFVAERYSQAGNLNWARKLSRARSRIQELEEKALAMGDVKVGSGRQEYLEAIINSLIIG